MKKDHIFPAFFALVIILLVIILMIYWIILPNSNGNSLKRSIKPFKVDIIGAGQFVKKDEEGAHYLDGAEQIIITLEDTYQAEFTVEVFLDNDDFTPPKASFKAYSKEVIDFSKIFSTSDDQEYLIVITAKKPGYTFFYTGKIYINTENLSPSIVFFGGQVNPKKIVLDADKDVVFHWIIKKNKMKYLTGVAQDALDAELKNLPEGDYEIENIAILTTKYSYQFEFISKKNFFIENNQNLLGEDFLPI